MSLDLLEMGELFSHDVLFSIKYKQYFLGHHLVHHGPESVVFGLGEDLVFNQDLGRGLD